MPVRQSMKSLVKACRLWCTFVEPQANFQQTQGFWFSASGLLESPDTWCATGLGIPGFLGQWLLGSTAIWTVSGQDTLGFQGLCLWGRARSWPPVKSWGFQDCQALGYTTGSLETLEALAWEGCLRATGPGSQGSLAMCSCVDSALKLWLGLEVGLWALRKGCLTSTDLGRSVVQALGQSAWKFCWIWNVSVKHLDLTNWSVRKFLTSSTLEILAPKSLHSTEISLTICSSCCQRDEKVIYKELWQ